MSDKLTTRARWWLSKLLMRTAYALCPHKHAFNYVLKHGTDFAEARLEGREP